MAFSEFEIKKYERQLNAFLEKHRPPMHIRSELDLGYRINGQSIEIFEIRPQWDDYSEILEHPVAKTTFVKTENCWKIFWMRADLKWHEYEPEIKVKTLSRFLEVVIEDEYACFFG
ncbi:hypothetical protein AWR38_12650 [Idiomarina sp. WRN-38]|uniref:DUF3024 domain-containing protein n=1 Tax=Idiomarina sp. OXR-189 TaxID=3100175 RepID=UPI0007338D53|nr:DUF3024 domain-containing protein [Idiomarina sp. OXR-189]KTG28948.1 hypothetical protein AUR68_12635 [Idiomarina sp. H105]OAF09713.1 hypothetical protein AWR38_12650 [Idiomarina sp. WRN-38]WPZ01622.1 DUF3024 domain-containing protein [Idiomarina sp. OXR-189]